MQQEGGVNVILEPEVYVVSRPSAQPAEVNSFLQKRGLERWESTASRSGDFLVEAGGRLCYMSFEKPRPGGNQAYLKHIKEAGHGSVLEHPNYTFLFAGISRSLSHELVRHRAGWAYSQLSQRYVDSSAVAFVVPPAMYKYRQDYLRQLQEGGHVQPAGDGGVYKGWLGHRSANLVEYSTLTELLMADAPAELPAAEKRKWARSAARSCLPNCTETFVMATANTRAVRHFVETRASRHAEAEIRALAMEVLDVMRREAPEVFSDYVDVELPDGTFAAETPHRKV
jgi:thymidylate synthase (FAD)